MCTYFEENDEEQLTITDLSIPTRRKNTCMIVILLVTYGNQYLKSSCKNTTGILYLWLRVNGSMILWLFEKRQVAFYGITLRYQTRMTKKPRRQLSLKLQKKLIKSDIKTHIMPIMSEYLKATDLELECTLEYGCNGPVGRVSDS